MRDRHLIAGFLLAGVLLAVLFVFYLLFKEPYRYAVLQEGGPVETASEAGYFLCALLMAYKGGWSYLKRFHYAFLVPIFLMLREMDFDHKFTTMGIFRTKFFLGDAVPVLEKLAGGAVVVLLLYISIRLFRGHFRHVRAGLRARDLTSIGILVSVVFLVAAKILDGWARRFRDMGYYVSHEASRMASALEEIVELGIPMMLLLTILAYFNRPERGARP